ncbi:MAG: nucleotidyltransferase family protein [Candidatus Omnitrophica bacterium]|nr:nucleotidyltransferase family protein [Candidatus Omnitrophota bacterium]
MEALILAAGYAKRLYPLTKDYPKPLLEIGKQPIIDHIVHKLENTDSIKKIWVITNNKFISYFRKWLRERNFRKSIELINDRTSSYKKRRGALGDIDFVIDKKGIRDDLIIVGGDNLFSEKLDGFISYVDKKRRYFVVGLYKLKEKRKAIHYGVVRIDKTKKIVDFEEKPLKPKSNLVCMCLYYFPKDKLFLLKKYLKEEKKNLDATGHFIDWLYRREKVYSYKFRGIWYDIGDHNVYKEAGKSFKYKRRLYGHQ